MTKEEFKKQSKMYFDSINPERDEPTDDCTGVMCSDCMFYHGYDCCYPADLFEIIEEFKKWVKEHQPITNKDKMEQVFGVEIDPKRECPPVSFGRCDRFIDCDGYSDCDKCKQWWNEEYKEPNGEVKE